MMHSAVTANASWLLRRRADVQVQRGRLCDMHGRAILLVPLPVLVDLRTAQRIPLAH